MTTDGLPHQVRTAHIARDDAQQKARDAEGRSHQAEQQRQQAEQQGRAADEASRRHEAEVRRAQDEARREREAMGRERAATEAAEARLREAHEASMGALETCNGWERRTLEAQAERDVALARLRSIEEAEAAVRSRHAHEL